MEAQGVEIMTCGTCLDYYNLKDKLAVGTVTNMSVSYTHLDVYKRQVLYCSITGRLLILISVKRILYGLLKKEKIWA